jgi:hypothetical protein
MSSNAPQLMLAIQSAYEDRVSWEEVQRYYDFWMRNLPNHLQQKADLMESLLSAIIREIRTSGKDQDTQNDINILNDKIASIQSEAILSSYEVHNEEYSIDLTRYPLDMDLITRFVGAVDQTIEDILIDADIDVDRNQIEQEILFDEEDSSLHSYLLDNLVKHRVVGENTEFANNSGVHFRIVREGNEFTLYTWTPERPTPKRVTSDHRMTLLLEVAEGYDQSDFQREFPE